jgi:hypothetical protein
MMEALKTLFRPLPCSVASEDSEPSQPLTPWLANTRTHSQSCRRRHIAASSCIIGGTSESEPYARRGAPLSHSLSSELLDRLESEIFSVPVALISSGVPVFLSVPLFLFIMALSIGGFCRW